MFTQHFAPYACEGDTITCQVGAFICTAHIYRDDCADKPDERDDGFWPSLDPNSAGYIGRKSPRTLARHTARAENTMEAWRNGEWFYCGIVVTIEHDTGPSLTTDLSHALWGVECNYPAPRSNNYLREVANELLPDALDEARLALRRLCECIGS